MKPFSLSWLKHRKWQLIQQGMSEKEASTHLASLIAYEKVFDKEKREAEKLKGKQTLQQKKGKILP